MEQLINSTQQIALYDVREDTSVKKRGIFFSVCDFIVAQKPECKNPHSIISRLLKSHNLPEGKRIRFEGDRKTTWGVPIAQQQSLFDTLFLQSKMKHVVTDKDSDSKLLIGTKKCDQYVREEFIRDSVAKSLDGCTEITIPRIGRIDILTTNSIIEVKYATKWISAIGQLTVYSHYYVKHQKVLWLYGPLVTKKQSDIELHCKTNNIKFIYDDRWTNGIVPLKETFKEEWKRF